MWFLTTSQQCEHIVQNMLCKKSQLEKVALLLCPVFLEQHVCFIALGSLWKWITYWSNEKENLLKLCCSSPELYHCQPPSSLASGLWGSKWLHSLAIKLVFLIKDAESSARAHPLHSNRVELPCFRLSSICITFRLWIKLLNNDFNLHISSWLRACSTILIFQFCSCEIGLLSIFTAADIAWRVNLLISQRL